MARRPQAYTAASQSALNTAELLPSLKFELPDCLFEDCIAGYDIKFINTKITNVDQTDYADCEILRKEDTIVKVFVDDFLAAVKKKARAKPGKPCKGDCTCASAWKWDPQITQVWQVPITRADGCKYTAVVEVTYQLGKNVGTCTFPDPWKPKQSE